MKISFRLQTYFCSVSTLLKETLQLVTEVINQSMATILPEKFDHGDFPAWLRQSECCASTNKWGDEDKALKLPEFLRGIVATNFHALTNTQKDSYVLCGLQSPFDAWQGGPSGILAVLKGTVGQD